MDEKFIARFRQFEAWWHFFPRFLSPLSTYAYMHPNFRPRPSSQFSLPCQKIFACISKLCFFFMACCVHGSQITRHSEILSPAIYDSTLAPLICKYCFALTFLLGNPKRFNPGKLLSLTMMLLIFPRRIFLAYENGFLKHRPHLIGFTTTLEWCILFVWSMARARKMSINFAIWSIESFLYGRWCFFFSTFLPTVARLIFSDFLEAYTRVSINGPTCNFGPKIFAQSQINHFAKIVAIFELPYGLVNMYTFQHCVHVRIWIFHRFKKKIPCGFSILFLCARAKSGKFVL